MQITARAMREAFSESVPSELGRGEWHLPYVTDAELAQFGDETCSKLSVVRCAAVSYERQHVARDLEAVVRRYDEMRSMGHWSPFEHQAVVDFGYAPGGYGNFRPPWRQLRKMFGGEAVFSGGAT
jgi:hypothetical protein